MAEQIAQETLSDSDRLDLVLEQLKYLDEQFCTLDEVDDAPDSLRTALGNAVEELSDLVGGQGISVSGTMVIPTTDSFGHVIGTAQAQGTLHDCNLHGITVINEELSDQFPQGAVTLQFAFGTQTFSTYTEETQITYMAIFPISQCNIHVVNELDDIMNDIAPEDDDEIAHEIDTALLNGPIDINKLASLVGTQFPDLSELQREMYLNHIQKVGNMGSMDVALTADEFVLYEYGNGEIEEHSFDEPLDVYGVFRGYVVSQVEDEGGREHFLLGVLVQSEDLGGLISIHAQDLTELTFVT